MNISWEPIENSNQYIISTMDFSITLSNTHVLIGVPFERKNTSFTAVSPCGQISSLPGGFFVEASPEVTSGMLVMLMHMWQSQTEYYWHFFKVNKAVILPNNFSGR